MNHKVFTTKFSMMQCSFVHVKRRGHETSAAAPRSLARWVSYHRPREAPGPFSKRRGEEMGHGDIIGIVVGTRGEEMEISWGDTDNNGDIMGIMLG